MTQKQPATKWIINTTNFDLKPKKVFENQITRQKYNTVLCHHLLNLGFFQPGMTFFLLLNTKVNILKNVGNQTQLRVAIDFQLDRHIGK